MSTITYLPINPISVSNITNRDAVKDLETIQNIFDSTEFKSNVHNKVSNKKNILDIHNLSSLKKVIEDNCSRFVKYTADIPFEKLYVTTSWLNVTKGSETHHNHSHPFSVVSGVIYFDDNPDNFNLTFTIPGVRVPYYDLDRAERIARIDLNYIVDNKKTLKNHMVLFYSDLKHEVGRLETNNKRRSLSFNTWWRGWTGTDNELMGVDFK